MCQTLPDQRLERSREGPSCVQLDVAIGGNREYCHLVLVLSDVLEQHQRGVIGPVEVVENVKERQGMTHTPEELAYAVEEEHALLLRRELQRWGNVVEFLSELWQYLGDLPGIFSKSGAETGGPTAQRLLKHFNVRYIRRRAFHLIATPRRIKHAMLARLDDQLLC